MCRALPGYHAFMGCNCTAAFCRKEKFWPFMILENNLKCQEVFGSIGLQEKYMKMTVLKLKRLASLDEVRLELFLRKYKPNESKLISNMKNIRGSQLLPCSRVAKEKIKRTITGVWLSLVFLSPPD